MLPSVTDYILLSMLNPFSALVKKYSQEVFPMLILSGRLLMKNKNSGCSKIMPCGTPLSEMTGSEHLSLWNTMRVLLTRKELIRFKEIPYNNFIII